MPGLTQLLDGLPSYLELQVRSYVDAMHDSLPEIADAVGAPPLDQETADRFLTVLATRRLWQLVRSQARIVDAALDLGSAEGIRGVRLGAEFYARNSAVVVELERTRGELLSMIRESGFADVILASGVQAALVAFLSHGR